MAYGENQAALGNRYVVGAGTSPVDPVSASPIRDGVTLAEEHLSGIMQAIGSLEKRLDTVLRPSPPSGVGLAEKAPPVPVCSHMMGRLRILNEGFFAAIERLRELESRVEV